MIEQLLKDERFNFISKENKNFVNEFTKQMDLIGYDFGGALGDGYPGVITWSFIHETKK